MTPSTMPTTCFEDADEVRHWASHYHEDGMPSDYRLVVVTAWCRTIRRFTRGETHYVYSAPTCFECLRAQAAYMRSARTMQDAGAGLRQLDLRVFQDGIRL